MRTKLSKKMENKKHTVIRVNKSEFELDNGDIYPHAFELDDDITVEEFQKLLDSSKDMVVKFLKEIEDNDE
jgi:hypothetical protein